MINARDIVTEKLPEGIFDTREGVDYPQFAKHFYYSAAAGRETGVNVLLPRSYDGVKKFPVLYILHGYFDNEDWMTRGGGGISTMLTNLTLDGEAEEMIVVLPYIFTSRELPACTGMNLQNSLAYDNFANDLFSSLMPFINSSFAVKTGRDSTAVTGFSMGGRESLFLGLTRSYCFGYVGAVCPAPGLTPGFDLSQHPGQIAKSEMRYEGSVPHVTFISAAKNDGVVRNAPMEYRDLLNENGAGHIFQTISYSGHDMSSVLPHLYNFFRMLFGRCG